MEKGPAAGESVAVTSLKSSGVWSEMGVQGLPVYRFSQPIAAQMMSLPPLPSFSCLRAPLERAAKGRNRIAVSRSIQKAPVISTLKRKIQTAVEFRYSRSNQQQQGPDCLQIVHSSFFSATTKRGSPRNSRAAASARGQEKKGLVVESRLRH